MANQEFRTKGYVTGAELTEVRVPEARILVSFESRSVTSEKPGTRPIVDMTMSTATSARKAPEKYQSQGDEE